MIRSRLLLLIPVLSLLAVLSCRKVTGPGNILVICSHDSYGFYTPDILKAEGISCFDTISVEAAGDLVLTTREHPAVILSSSVAGQALREKLLKYVSAGGQLICVLPPDQGWEGLFTEQDNTGKGTSTYLLIDTLKPEAAGLTGHRIRVHSARVRSVAGKPSVLASFGDTAAPGSDDPAVVTVKNGRGTITAFMYNLPENIVLTRQGNPSDAGLEKDGIPGLRAMDLFTGGWVDTDCNTINQADEQMHLLSGIIFNTVYPGIPMPRTWYFPDTLKCLVTLTNDGEFRAEKDFEIQFRDLDSAGASMSLYVMQTAKVSRDWARRWAEKGFEIAGHPDNTSEAASPVWQHVDSVLAAMMKDIEGLYGLKMTTVVNHWFVWCGTDARGRQEFTAQAQIEEGRGLLLDANYAHYDNNSSSGHFLGSQGTSQGNYTGSGLPMKFAASSGRVLNIWQHLNNVYDQQYNENHDPEGFFDAFRGLMDRSIDKDVWSYISIKSHNDEYYFSKEPLLKMIAYAHKRGVPVWTAARLAAFLEQRDKSLISDVDFNGKVLSFRYGTVTAGGDNPGLLIPLEAGGRKISSVKVNEHEGNFIRTGLRGKQYIILTVNEPGINSIEVSFD